jgi:hypothetical protein
LPSLLPPFGCEARERERSKGCFSLRSLCEATPLPFRGRVAFSTARRGGEKLFNGCFFPSEQGTAFFYFTKSFVKKRYIRHLQNRFFNETTFSLKSKKKKQPFVIPLFSSLPKKEKHPF